MTEAGVGPQPKRGAAVKGRRELQRCDFVVAFMRAVLPRAALASAVVASGDLPMAATSLETILLQCEMLCRSINAFLVA